MFGHRLRKDPLETIDSGNKVKEVFAEVFEIDEKYYLLIKKLIFLI